MNLEKLLKFQVPAVEARMTAKDAMLYALGVGVGDRPEDPADLQFVYERAQPFKVVPSYVNVICHPGGWIMAPELEVDWVKLLHGEQGFEMHKQLKPDTSYVSSNQILGVVDKGAGKGAMLFLRKQLHEVGSGDLVSTIDSTYVLRGDGGCGSTLAEAPAPHALPQRAPDAEVSLPTLQRAALIYRLSGDFNPIHADPAIARKAGFERPILHGLCSLGLATRAVLRACCDDDPERLKSLKLRFSSPVYPGETLVTEVWRDGREVSFRTRVAERDVVVLNNGRAVLA
ncbi:3-alpha,7-alpha,12-alpha-trihydroxy-5-beta-cholest-24-enoyl-CoA hydratase [Ramlibacter sp. G-1-2-2]|uniref:3-alpha,7-alpha, 12-alpha-trihydroxy-5-beta-cholest-24-enoyl-CoA hydratase n=1 Tax=Ramlibacter agri TaxID=2728837 RepID=A0A848GXM7_9BURK|nr:MaoC/PaaZ C-terminal domain-containing protein [Ramlibacter agri]NML43345.1 3-alpha,7-alpha,12-alpha-trihydroxy-5-beta-cholest-24-enoyl-CoA hydratase [Ramlibacter agri]